MIFIYKSKIKNSHSFRKFVLSIYCMQSSVLGTKGYIMKEDLLFPAFLVFGLFNFIF